MIIALKESRKTRVDLLQMETSRKRLRMTEEANQPSSGGKNMKTFLEQFEEQENAKKEQEKNLETFLEQFEEQENAGSDDNAAATEQTRSVAETLHTLEEGITSIRYCLEKPKPKRVNLNEINRKIDLILEILYSWNTAASP